MRIIVIVRVGLPVVAAFALFAGAATSVQADTFTNLTAPVSGTVPDPCNGQVVTFSGTAHALLSIRQNASGGFFVTSEVNFADVTGTASGDTYHVLSDVVESIDTNGALTATIAGQESLVSRGSSSNAEGHSMMHLTINANGQPTASVQMTSITCNG